MRPQETIILTRDTQAILVPAGTPVTLPQGTEVMLMQELGGSYTISIYGNLARINGVDADALGKQPQEFHIEIPQGEKLNVDFILKQLRQIFDPEIPVNIIDLGLIYKCILTESTATHFTVEFEMTLTAPGCGIGPVLVEDVKRIASSIPGVDSVEVNLVFDPPWSQQMMSPDAQLQLGLI